MRGLTDFPVAGKETGVGALVVVTGVVVVVVVAGTIATSNDPIEQRAERAVPCWSTPCKRTSAQVEASPAPRAILLEPNPCVCVEPPLDASGRSDGFPLKKLVGEPVDTPDPHRKLQDPSSIKLLRLTESVVLFCETSHWCLLLP